MALTKQQLEIRAFFEKHNEKVKEKIKAEKDTEQFHIILGHLGIPQLNTGG